MEKQQESAQDISWEKRLQCALKDIVREMSRDKSEGSYYYAWQANIAMAFHDEFVNMLESGEIEAKFNNSFTFHDCCNNAAKRFLDQLCHESSSNKLITDKNQGELEVLKAENSKMRQALVEVSKHCKAAGVPKFKEDWVLIEIDKIATETLKTT